jgi:hypothetical protein
VFGASGAIIPQKNSRITSNFVSSRQVCVSPACVKPQPVSGNPNGLTVNGNNIYIEDYIIPKGREKQNKNKSPEYMNNRMFWRLIL